MKILWNEIRVLSSEIGVKLLPVVRDALGWALKVADGFGKMEKGTKKMVTTIGMIAATIGPVLIVGGKFITTVGKVTKVVTTAGQAFKAAQGVSKFSAALGSVISPAGMVVIGIAAVAAGAYLLYKAFSKTDPAITAMSKKLAEYREEQSRLKISQEEYIKTNSVEIYSIERLRDRLSSLFDANVAGSWVKKADAADVFIPNTTTANAIQNLIVPAGANYFRVVAGRFAAIVSSDYTLVNLTYGGT